MNNIKEVLKELYSLQRFGIKPGLERTLYLLEKTGNPHLKLKSIHVAGTNGKGTVTSLIASILIESGYKTGLYTSPHLLRFNERIQINGEMISDSEIVDYASDLMEIGKKINATFFELTTVLAFLYFAQKKVDIAVIETGMGGRFDSTNVLDPLISIITKISRDHTQYLGDTIEKIASEKAGIIKPGIPVVTCPQVPEAAEVLENASSKAGSELFVISDTKENIYNIFPENLQIVLKSIELLKLNFNRINDRNISAGILNLKKNIYYRGRIEKLSDKPLLILDVSHNIDSVEKLCLLLRKNYPEKIFTFIYASVDDKESLEILKLIKPLAEKLILTQANTHRAFSTEKLEEFAQIADYRNYEIINTVEKVVEYIMNSDEDTVIFGSFFLAGEFLEYYEK